MEPTGYIPYCTVDQLHAALIARELSVTELVEVFLQRIESVNDSGAALHAIVEVNPDVDQIAAKLDNELRAGISRGPLHGIPILLKDNIDTADRMMTTAGSLALVGSAPAYDATVAHQLRGAGGVLIGKTNMSEWANFRSTSSTSGWSARGGQCRSPYASDRNPSGSSSGSAVAVAAGLCTVALGTETDGSITSPANNNGIVGLKPTVGLTSRAGVVPVSATQDSVGAFGRTVADVAHVLNAIVARKPDPNDLATVRGASNSRPDYTFHLKHNGLSGARIGVARSGFFGRSAHADRIAETAVLAMADAGAVIIDPADIDTASQLGFLGPHELPVLLCEFKDGINAYLNRRHGLSVHSLADCIAFNEAHADEELRLFGQDLFLRAQQTDALETAGYRDALRESRRLARDLGIDATLRRYNLDAIISPAGSPAWITDHVNGDHIVLLPSSPAAQAGYPLLTMPAGQVDGLPVGIVFMGSPYAEHKLIELGYAFELATQGFTPPFIGPPASLAQLPNNRVIQQR